MSCASSTWRSIATGTRSSFASHRSVRPVTAERAACFDPDAAPGGPTTQGFAWLETLWSTIEARAAERPSGSYTASLLGSGVDAVARKVTEEATEVLIAAKDDAVAQASGTEREATRSALAGETADLLYHALVLLAERDLEPAVVIDALRARHQR